MLLYLLENMLLHSLIVHLVWELLYASDLYNYFLTLIVLFYENRFHFSTSNFRGTAIYNKLLCTYDNVICINYFDLHNYIITNSIIIFVRFNSCYRLF